MCVGPCSCCGVVGYNIGYTMLPRSVWDIRVCLGGASEAGGTILICGFESGCWCMSASGNMGLYSHCLSCPCGLMVGVIGLSCR